MRSKAFLFAAVAALAVSGCRSAPSWMKPGMAAPPIEGRTVDGQSVSLAAEKGRVVAVVFFADWCPHCRALYPAERELAERNAGKAFSLIAVDADNTADEIRSAVRRERITWPVVHDADGSIASAWGVDGLPTVYVLDRSGVIRHFDVLDSALIRAVDELLAETP